MMSYFRSEKGFTLIELMVVILIIGILVAIAIPVFGAARREADKRACQANLRTIIGAAETYRAGNTGYPADIQAIKDAGYLKAVPTCPSSGTYTFSSSATGGADVTCSEAVTLGHKL